MGSRYDSESHLAFAQPHASASPSKKARAGGRACILGVTPMGASFLVVNPAKRQYLNPARFGEGNKFSPVLRGCHCIQALKLLISDERFRRDDTSFSAAWLGDPVILASDDGGLPDPACLATATTDEPARNLHAVARAEFADISYRALAELCRNPETAVELAARCNNDESLLIDLGATLEQYRVPTLERALNVAVGRPWRKGYNQARAKLSWWHPLPPIDWPL
jgi:hypothetical protein